MIRGVEVVFPGGSHLQVIKLGSLAYVLFYQAVGEIFVLIIHYPLFLACRDIQNMAKDVFQPKMSCSLSFSSM